MLSKFQSNIEEHFPFLKEGKLLIACSGGLDSVVLCYLLNAMNSNISIAHCNFSLRGKESEQDELFVKDLAKSLNAPFFSETFDTKKYAKEHQVSTQMAARDLRYSWFNEVMVSFKLEYLLTGHHLDDDLETFLINLSRGTGLKGLTGIPTENQKIIRPLLSFSREEITNYANQNNLKWREDSSNKKSDYLRNKLRLDVIPPFKEADENLLKNFKKTQQNLIAAQNLVDDYMTLVYKSAISETEDGYKISISKLEELPNTEAILYQLLNGFGFTQWADIKDLMSAQSGKQVFSSTHRLLKNRADLLLTEINSEENATEISISENQSVITTPIFLKFEEVQKIETEDKYSIFIDYDVLVFPLKLKRWEQGDSFVPFGMKGKKKLSKFFKDEKLSLNEKEKTWILWSGNKVVWVVGLRMDNRFMVSEKTNKIIKITYKNK